MKNQEEKRLPDKLADGLSGIMIIICVIIFAVMVFAVSYGVIGRYIPFIKNPRWTQELAILCMVWLCFLGSGYGIKEGLQIRQHAGIGILNQIHIVHLDHVGQLIAGHLSGHLAPVFIPGSKFGVDLDVRIFFFELGDGGHGFVMAGLAAPPEHPQGGLFFGGSEHGQHGANQHSHQQDRQEPFHNKAPPLILW